MHRYILGIALIAALLYGCGNAGIRDYWNTHTPGYSDLDAAQDVFASYAEEAVAAHEADALASLDVLFDRLKEDEVAYYIYSEWMEGAFYNILSPCRNASLYSKAVRRIVSDGILRESDYAPMLQKAEWGSYNLVGTHAVLPGVSLDGRRTLVLVLDMGCPSCKDALTGLASNPEWEDVRRVAICFGYGAPPSEPGWEYFYPDNAGAVFDPALTPIYFVVSPDSTIEQPYKPAL